jgi:hypothetical protein
MPPAGASRLGANQCGDAHRSQEAVHSLEVTIDQSFGSGVLHTCAVDHCCLQATARTPQATIPNTQQSFRLTMCCNIPDISKR